MNPAPPVTRYEAMRNPSLPRETGARNSGQKLKCVLVIELPQHRVRQAETVQLPERVIVAVVIEVFVVGFEDAPIVRELIRLIAVLAEQDAILVLDEELASHPRLSAEVVEHRTHFR